MAKKKENEENPVAAGSKKGKSKLMLIVPMVVLILGGSGFGAYAFWGKKTQDKSEQTDASTKDAPSDEHAKDEHAKDGHGGDGHGESKKEDTKKDGHGGGHGGDNEGQPEEEDDDNLIVELESIFVTLKASHRSNNLRVVIGIKVDTKEAKAELSGPSMMEPKVKSGKSVIPVRDFIIEEIANARVEDIESIVGKNGLKRRLLNGINRILEGGRAEKIYFSQFIMQ